MTDSPLAMDDGSDQELSRHSHQPEPTDGLHVGSNRLPNGIVPVLSDSNEVAVLRDENSRLLTTLLEYKKMLDTTKLRYGTMKREFYAAKKRMKRLADKLQNSGSTNVMDSSDSGGSTPMQQQQQNANAPVDEDIRKKWKEPNLKAAIKLKAAIGVQSYQSLIRDGELQLPSLRTISRYVDALKKAGLKPNYDFNVRDSDTVGSNVFVEEDGEEEDSGEVDHNRNQAGKATLLEQQLQRPPARQLSRDGSDGEDPVDCTAMPDINYFRGKMEHDDDLDDDFDEDQASDLYSNGVGGGGGGDPNDLTNRENYQRHPNQHTYQQQHTLTMAHIEFLKSMTGFRKKWTPFELRTCMDIRRIIGSKEYDSLRKNDGMPLPSAKTLRKYKHTVHLDGVDVMSRKRSYREMVEGLVTNGHGVNGELPDDDILNAEEPDGYFDINNLTEQQIDFLQSLSGNTKGFSDYELQKTLELKNELGGQNYEILRKQECLHIPTLAVLKRYEHDNGLEDLSAMVAAEDVDDDDDQEPEQEPEQDYDNELQAMDHYAGGGMNGTGDDSHMGVFEHHSIFDKDVTAFDMSKLSQHHVEFLNTLPENPKRWTQHMINSALNIKNEIGTRDYELLRRQGIPLPAARTLRRHKDIKSRLKEEYSEGV
ncbi:uncharacterized protein LOC109419235 [Aedes albopictus]|uniref:Uncharacterized protein n=1 Tax=Aedes albopictus TaxID=7160 RepID=A0ABM1ZSJ9_AEDAL